MAEQQTIKYAPQWINMTVDNVIFQTNNVVVVYQNFLREFWSTSVAFDPFPSIDEPEKRPLKEFLIKFLVLNRQRHLTLDFDTFCSSTGLNYNNDKYVDHPTPEVVKKELGKIAINPSYLDKTLVLKNSFPVAWRILFTFVIQVLGGNYSSTKQVNSIQQLLAYSLITGTEVDIGEIIYSDLVTKLLNKSRLKYVSYPRFISCALQVLLGSEYNQDKKFRFLPPILSNSNFTKDPSKVTDIVLTAHMIVGLEASGALSKKSKRPKSKNPPTETKVTPPKLMEAFEQSHSVSSGTVHDPQDLERDIQLASTGLPSTLDKGTRKSKPLPKITDNELTAHMIAVNNQRDLVSPPPLAAKPKKGKSQTVTSTLPQSHGPDASEALFKKRKQPESKRPSTETKESPPKPMEASTGLPSTLDEGTRQSKPLPEGTATHPKDSGGNKQPLDRDITSTTSDEGTAKTTPRPEVSLGDKDSEGNIPPADMEPIHTPVADPSRAGAKYQVDETQSTRLRYRSLIENEGKTSYEVEPDIKPLQLQTFADIQAYLLSEDELDKESDEELLKTKEYDLWSMRMEQYLTFTDHALWEVIVNGDSVSPVASASTGAEGPIPPKTVEQKLARKND
ncbi:hypothetical protein Tco_0542843 [Tanacetum coccineum]